MTRGIHEFTNSTFRHHTSPAFSIQHSAFSNPTSDIRHPTSTNCQIKSRPLELDSLLHQQPLIIRYLVWIRPDLGRGSSRRQTVACEQCACFPYVPLHGMQSEAAVRDV